MSRSGSGSGDGMEVGEAGWLGEKGGTARSTSMGNYLCAHFFCVAA